jgi:hypothetical protein
MLSRNADQSILTASREKVNELTPLISLPFEGLKGKSEGS